MANNNRAKIELIVWLVWIISLSIIVFILDIIFIDTPFPPINKDFFPISLFY